jgi:hypothetical protein
MHLTFKPHITAKERWELRQFEGDDFEHTLRLLDACTEGELTTEKRLALESMPAPEWDDMIRKAMAMCGYASENGAKKNSSMTTHGE